MDDSLNDPSANPNHSTHSLTPSSSSNLPQVRSRITVVCAECKRLKLKCDRRTPCGSCLKRDTVVRCIYSPAAAEKVDLHSLNNRLIQVESTLAQLTTSPRASASFHARRSSAIMLCLQDLQQTCAEDIGVDILGDSHAGPSTSTSRAFIKQEPHTTDTLFSDGKLYPTTGTPSSFWSLPSTSVYQCDSHSSQSYNSLQGDSMNPLYMTPDSLQPQQSTLPPQTTPALLGLLPKDQYHLSCLLDRAEECVSVRPSFWWSRFRHRAEELLGFPTPAPGMSNDHKHGKSMNAAKREDQARSIFFNVDKRKKRKATSSTALAPHDTDHSHNREDSLCFFAAACAALALGALSEELRASTDEPGRTTSVGGDNLSAGDHRSSYSSAFLYSLSQQAVSVHESYLAQCNVRENGAQDDCGYDLDYLTAGILQHIIILKSPTSGGASKAMGLVGKMVNVARQMGLGNEPDRQHSIMEEWEKDERRRIWWEIVWCDLYVSDAMGHQPLIGDGSFTTRIPTEGDPYFELKCRLMCLVRKMQSHFHGSPSTSSFGPKSEYKPYASDSNWAGGSYTLDQAASFEAEVKSLLDDIPRLLSPEGSHSGHDEIKLTSSEAHNTTTPIQDHVKSAQHCELTIMAHRLVLRVYYPFLKQPQASPSPQHDGLSSSAEAWIPPHQATYAVVNASHAITLACRTMYHLWQTHGQPSNGGKFGLMPALFDLYPVWRSQFDAIVLCAQSCIKQPTTMWASLALEDVQAVTEFYANSRIDFSELPWAGLEFSEAIKIIGVLKAKAESADKGGAASTSLKRKHGDVEASDHPGQKTADNIGEDTLANAEKAAEATTSKGKGSKSSRKQSYPSVGIRVRPGSSSSPTSATSPSSVKTPSIKSSGSRRRAGSTSTTSTSHHPTRLQAAPASLHSEPTPPSSTPSAPTSGSASDVVFAFPPTQEPTASSLMQQGYHSRRGSDASQQPQPSGNPASDRPASVAEEFNVANHGYDQYPQMRAPSAFDAAASSANQSYPHSLPAHYQRLGRSQSSFPPTPASYATEPSSSSSPYRPQLSTNSSFAHDPPMSSSPPNVPSPYSHTPQNYYMSTQDYGNNQRPQQAQQTQFSLAPPPHSQGMPMAGLTPTSGTPQSHGHMYDDGSMKTGEAPHDSFMGVVAGSNQLHQAPSTSTWSNPPASTHLMGMDQQPSQYWPSASDDANARYYRQ